MIHAVARLLRDPFASAGGGAALAPRVPQARLHLVDGLRGLAAACVLFFHYSHFYQTGAAMENLPHYRERMPFHAQLWPLYEHGHLAVQLFWLISGFVFALVYYGGPATTRSFVVNRVARLYPLHLLTLCVVAALQAFAVLQLGHWIIYPNNDMPHFLWQLAFLGWLPNNGNSFNGPIWSVSVELVAYALFWLSRRQMTRLGLVGPVAAALAVMLVMQLFGHHPVLACLYYFFCGVVLAVLLRSGIGPRALGLLGAGALLAGALLAIVGSQDLRDYIALPAAGGGLILLLALAEDRAGPGLRHVAGMLGDSSYSLYLWHVPLQMVLILGLSRWMPIAQLADSPWFLLLFIALGLAVARASFLWFERPARDWLRRFAH